LGLFVGWHVPLGQEICPVVHGLPVLHDPDVQLFTHELPPQCWPLGQQRVALVSHEPLLHRLFVQQG
jgi:hypothetical protein